MKIRNGFVSNSSSSSFVVIGVKSNVDYEEMKEKDLVQKLNLKDRYELEKQNSEESDKLKSKISSLYIEDSKYDYVTGFIISDDEYLEETSTTFAEFKVMAQILSDELNVDISEIQLVTGTRPC